MTTSNSETSQENSTSPLEETDPQSLDALFSADPLSLTREDKRLICIELRKGRARWAQEELTSKTSGKRAKPSAGMKKADLSQINLNLDDVEI